MYKYNITVNVELNTNIVQTYIERNMKNFQLCRQTKFVEKLSYYLSSKCYQNLSIYLTLYYTYVDETIPFQLI